MVRDLMDLGLENGFNVLRAWAHTVSHRYALQESPGVYNEGVSKTVSSRLIYFRRDAALFSNYMT